MRENEYQCAQCKGIFEKGWSEEEAVAERDHLFAGHTDFAVVCDDCFNEIMGFDAVVQAIAERLRELEIDWQSSQIITLNELSKE